VLCFAAVGSIGPRFNRRFGLMRVLVAALVCGALGLVARALAEDLWLFLLASVLALTAGAISNVSMPTLVKQYFPGRIAALTAIYTTAMALGATAASGLTVPIGHLRHGVSGWRLGLGSWALFMGVAALCWLPFLGGTGERPLPVATLSGRALVRSPTAWALTLLFGGQSFQAYVAFGWFARFFRDHGVSETRAGVMVAFYAALSIPTSMLAPWLAARAQRRSVLAFCGCYLVGYVGLAAAPVGGAWLWMLLIGIGSGLFPVTLTMIGLHTRHVTVTASVSAFVQGVGYILAGTGPLLVGWLVGASHRWAGAFGCLFGALAVSVVGGVLATRPRAVDDETGPVTVDSLAGRRA
jgi:MFS transporter, CP family, cyanate transporter